MVNHLPQIDESLHPLQNIILHERYVEPFFGPSNENDAIISQNIDKLKEFYEQKVLDWKYLRPKGKQRSQST